MALEKPMAPPQKAGLGAAVIVGAVFLMATQDALIKYVSADLALSQIFFLRSLLVLPVLSAIAGRTLRSDWTNAFGPWPLARAALLSSMYLLLYAAIPFLPLSTLAAGFYTGPLFITLLSGLVLKEKVGLRGWAAVSIGFLGVLVLLQPGTEAFSPLALVPVLSGFCYALAAVVTRGPCQSDSPASLALSLNICLLGTGGLLLGLGTAMPILDGGWSFLFRPWAAMALAEWLLMASLAIFMIGIGLGLAAAYQLAPPVIIASFDYSYLVFATLWGLVLFAEVPDLTTWIGMFLILAAGLTISWQKRTSRGRG